MNVSVDLSALARTKWWEFGIRFLFGGTITVFAGLLARELGPVLGGLFLAFPAIFPASATLIEKHEREKKQLAGVIDTIRGRQAAALDARGAAFGTVGLAVFGFIAWNLLPRWNAGLVLSSALLMWVAVAVLVWRASKKYARR
jgi:Protein of unknown function (DUF3147)